VENRLQCVSKIVSSEPYTNVAMLTLRYNINNEPERVQACIDNFNVINFTIISLIKYQNQ